MKTNIFTLLVITLAFCLPAKSQVCDVCPSCDSLLTGTYNGNISWGSGSGRLCIAAGAVVNGNVNNTSLRDICIQGTVNGIVTNEATGDIYLSGTINGGVDNQANGHFFSSGVIDGDIIIDGLGNLCNDGVIKNGTLTLSSTGDFNNHGAADFLGDITISGTGLINSDCSVEIGGSLFITGNGDITLSGELIIAGDLVLTSTGDVTVTGSIQVLGDLTLISNGGVLIDGNLVVIGNTTVSGLGNIELESGAYFSTNDLTLTSTGDVDGVGGSAGQVVILGVGSTGSITSNFEDNLNVCGSCVGCNSSGGVNFTSSPCASSPAISLNLSANCISVLPVTLLSFTATPINQTVLLNWVTTTEINNDYFTIEKSKDAINWVKLVDVLGAGNSTQNLYYSTSDDAPYSGISYYRLKQTDFNGAYEYFNIVAVTFDKSSKTDIFPNPFTDYFTVQLSSTTTYPITLQVTNCLGEIIINKQISEKSTDNMLTIDGLISSGIYFVTIHSETGFLTLKAIKK